MLCISSTRLESAEEISLLMEVTVLLRSSGPFLKDEGDSDLLSSHGFRARVVAILDCLGDNASFTVLIVVGSEAYVGHQCLIICEI